jgi:hypothetical protein
MFVATDERPDLGELWFIVFDSDRPRPVVRKREVPLSGCRFSPDDLQVDVAGATLDAHTARGEFDDIGWNLRYEGDNEPLLLLPEALYRGGFPKAKSVVPLPSARFSGTLRLGDEVLEIDGWPGSQNHNWGSRHTDRYAWGQVTGFDDAPDVFLECATAKVKLGSVWTPWVTLATVRIGGDTVGVNDLFRGARARAKVGDGRWSFHSRRGDLELRAAFSARAEDFVALRYHDPPGGAKTCLNSKTARCELDVIRGGERRRFVSKHRAAFERLVDPNATDRSPVV